MKDGFFDFTSDSVMITNIFGSEQSYPYIMGTDDIQQKGLQEVNYSIDYRVKDTIILSAEIYSYAFRFLAVRDTLALDSLSTR